MYTPPKGGVFVIIFYMLDESFHGDPLGLQPKDASPQFRDIATYNHLVRSTIFGNEKPEERKIRISMFGTDLDSGLMGEIAALRTMIDRLTNFTPAQYEALCKKQADRTMEEAQEIVHERLKKELANLSLLNRQKLELTKQYNPDLRTPGNEFNPPNQTGYTCVPTSLHEVGKRVIKEWPFKSMAETQKAFGDQVHGEWTNPSTINEFIRALNQQGVPVAARYCTEPLTLTAGIRAGGMAVAKHQDWDHVYIIEDFGKENDHDLKFVVGNTHGGTVKNGVSLTEIDESFFKPSQINSVTVIVPVKK